MYFSQITTPFGGIIQGIERETGLGLGTISDNAAPDYYLADFLRRINEWLHITETWIREINDEQVFDDTNNTETILKSYNFTDDIQTYNLDSDIVNIIMVEVLDVSNVDFYQSGIPTSVNIGDYWIDSDDEKLYRAECVGADQITVGEWVLIGKADWITLDYYYQKDRVENLYNQNSGMPSKYFLQNRQIIFDVPVDTTKAVKYRITKQMHAHEFVIGDTTAEPGFDKRFHPILIYGATMDWTKDAEVYNKCRVKIFGIGEGDPNALKIMLQDYYRNQNKDLIYKIGRKSVNYE